VIVSVVVDTLPLPSFTGVREAVDLHGPCRQRLAQAALSV
jgi:hypothetical protein